jgi:hypothetical protein
MLVAFTTGCAVSADDYPDQDEQVETETDNDAPDVELSQHTEAILGGAMGSTYGAVPSGAVEIITPGGGCSGVMVGSSMVFTSAHCHQVNQVNGEFMGKIQLALSGTTWRCLTGSPESSSGKCREDRAIWFERYDSAPIPAAGRDFMVLFPGDFGAPWHGNVAHLAAHSIVTAQMGGWDLTMTLFGRGFGTSSGADNGVMRFATFAMASAAETAGSFSYKAPANFRPCAGDSGGPYLVMSGNSASIGALLGIHTGAVESGDCARSGGKVIGTKLSSTKMDWVNVKRGDSGYGPCSHPLWSHWDCQ